MEKQIADRQQDRISMMDTVFESVTGRNLAEASRNLPSEQVGFSDGVALRIPLRALHLYLFF
ncbi:MAG: hypothetical protein ABSG96_23055 [Terracidiphilus sp.]